MKNIEKFPSTKEALDAYNNLVSKTQTFDKWLDCEFVEPPKPTLLEVSELFLNFYLSDSLEYRIVNDFREAIAREKKKLFRNCDKYKTVEESKMAFMEMCNKTKCRECMFKDTNSIVAEPVVNCYSKWLYAEAKNEN